MATNNRLADRLNANKVAAGYIPKQPEQAKPSVPSKPIPMVGKVSASAPKKERATVKPIKTKPPKKVKEKKKPKEKIVPIEIEETPLTEEQLELAELKKLHQERNRERRWKLSTRIINIFLVVACLYVVFLIYGVAVTDYQYTESGTVVAQKLTVDDIREKKAYETVLVQYEKCRILYEQTLMLDYRLGAGEEDPLIVAPEYEALLDTVTDLSVKTDALEVESQYSQMKNMLLSWIQNDIAVYLQNMSTAISMNNTETANNALQDRDRVYNNFSLITQNIVATGETIAGIDITDIKEWTPEKYVDETINGKR